MVSLTSSLEVSSDVNVSRRQGFQILDLQMENALKIYKEGMDIVDRSDQYPKEGMGFATKAHYKKQYKKAYFAIMDFMTLKSYLALNM